MNGDNNNNNYALNLSVQGQNINNIAIVSTLMY